MAAASITKTLTKFRPIGAGDELFYLSRQKLNDGLLRAFSDSASETASSSTVGKSEKGSRTLSKWLLFLPGAITFGLGTWQIFRRRVICKGVFDEEKSVYVGPRSRSISRVTENGYYVVTPLMPIPNNPESVQSPVLVNRGWVPHSWRDKSLEDSRENEQPLNIEPSVQQNERSSWWKFWPKKPTIIEDQVPVVAPVEVVGVIRGSEKPSIFVPANDPSSCQWFHVDVPAISHASWLSKNTIYIEDINENVNPSNPYPVLKDVNTLIRSSVMPQEHLNYALTWYSLSAAVTFMAYKILVPKKTRR
ncbi:surfeit locus protein 1-like isoform X2 [Mangifera indica]|uniref:surfeit locus protein 1-like isoform X2 n=1 Tax=Mangifera indica TaxID=29780 RepID=UPI001CF9AC5C|nr:surfeit locus protein 1-like isoform X2 [Mangifera indica]